VRARFYLPEIDDTGQGVLAGDEAGHLTRVLRLGVGADIDVFDGRGGMFHARVESINRNRVRVRVAGSVPFAAESALRVTLVMSVLKGDKMDNVVRDAVMMGVAGVQPVVAARSEVRLSTVVRGDRTDRWQRIAVSAVKQCGRATVPAVHAPFTLEAWLEHRAPDPVLVLSEPAAGGGRPLSEVRRTEAVQLLVGPEGGWAREESAAFRAAGFQAVSLGGRTIRADAAPLVAMAALYEAWKGW
jgi:16S rRNA (uracil1498-N3)-methyltransferase